MFLTFLVLTFVFLAALQLRWDLAAAAWKSASDAWQHMTELPAEGASVNYPLGFINQLALLYAF